MSDNKVTLFHLLSATAAKQNAAQKNNTPKVYDYVEDEAVDVMTLPEEAVEQTPQFTDTYEDLQESPSVSALFEEDAPSTGTAFTKEEIAFENERFEDDFQAEVSLETEEVEEAKTEDLPSWESSRANANMQVFASNAAASSNIEEESVSFPTAAEETPEFSLEQEEIEGEDFSEASPLDFTEEQTGIGEQDLHPPVIESDEIVVEHEIDTEANFTTFQDTTTDTPTFELEETEAELEYLDDSDNFDTQDVDEAYRQRLIALGLEPIETETEVVEASTPETAAPQDVDEALSQVFASPSLLVQEETKEQDTVTATEEATTVSEPPTREHFSPLDFHTDEGAKGANAPSDSKPLTETNKQASMLQQFRQLQDRNSTFVFMFGRQQAGKTVVLSSLAYHMGTDENGLLETRRRVDNLKGAAYLKQLSESVRKGQFMNRTAVGSLYELDLTYTPNKPEIPMNFTFLEMSGEDLTKVELSETTAGNLPTDIEVYLKCPNLNVVFMLVVPYEDAEEHDYLVIDFLDYLKERQPDFDYSKLLLLISKWDRYDGLRKDEVDMFVKEQMPRTYSRLKAKKATLARYSIGEVSDDNQQILELNQERPAVVKKWLYQASTGQKIKDESTSFWNKIKSWV